MCVRSVLLLFVTGIFLSMFYPLSRASAALSLQSSFDLSGTFTNNLFFNDKNTKSDFGTLFGPNLTLLFENPDIVLGVTYFGQMQYYYRNPAANRYVQNANIILDLPFLSKQYRGLTVTIDETMNFTPQLDAFSLSSKGNSSTTRRANQVNVGNTGVGNAVGGISTTGGTSTTGRAAVGAGGTTIGVGNGFGGTGGIDGTGVFTNRANAFANNAAITFGYVWTPRSRSSWGYSNDYLHFFSKGFQDSLTHNGTISHSYRLTRQTTLSPFYSYSQTEFIGNSNQGTSADRLITHNPQLRISHSFAPSLTVFLEAGVGFTKQIGATEQIRLPGNMIVTRKISEKFRKTFTGSASVTKTYPQGAVELSFSQVVGTGGGLAAQGTRFRNATGNMSHALSQRIQVNASLGWAKNDSIGGNAFKTTTYQVQAGLQYFFFSWLSGDFNYTHIKQTSKGNAGTDLDVNQFFLGVVAIADQWFLFR